MKSCAPIPSQYQQTNRQTPCVLGPRHTGRRVEQSLIPAQPQPNQTAKNVEDDYDLRPGMLWTLLGRVHGGEQKGAARVEFERLLKNSARADLLTGRL